MSSRYAAALTTGSDGDASLFDDAEAAGPLDHVPRVALSVTRSDDRARAGGSRVVLGEREDDHLPAQRLVAFAPEGKHCSTFHERTGMSAESAVLAPPIRRQEQAAAVRPVAGPVGRLFVCDYLQWSRQSAIPICSDGNLPRRTSVGGAT